MYEGGGSGRVFKSVNAGASWSEVLPGGAATFSWQTLSADSTGQKIIAGVFDGRLFYSEDSGQNWVESQPNGDQNQNWFSASLSQDGSTVLIGTLYGRLFLSKPPTTSSPAPSTQSTSTSATSSVGSAAVSSPTCDVQAPSNAPDLFEIRRTKTEAVLYFAPVLGVDSYHIAYGEGKNTMGHGVEFTHPDNTGVVAVTIYHLDPKQGYTFMVRGGNSCKAGPWSTALSAKVPKERATTVSYRYFGTLGW